MPSGDSTVSSTAETASAHPPAGTMPADHWKSGPFTGLCFAVVAALAAWAVLRAVHPVFWTTKGADEFGFLPLDVQWALDRNNVLLMVGMFGGLVGAALAGAEAWARRSWRTALLCGAGCAGIGVLAGALGGYLGFRVFEAYKANAEVADLHKAVFVFGTMFATLGGVLGLGLGAILGRSGKTALNCLVGGLLAGGLASILYPVIVAGLIPGAATTVLIPQGGPERLLWFALPAGLLGLILPALAKRREAGRQKK